VYDRALKLRPDHAIVEQTVKAAMRELGEIATSRPTLPGLQTPEPQDSDDIERDELGDLDDELPSEEMSELVDRLDILRRHVDDPWFSIDDPLLARREFRNIEEEIGQSGPQWPSPTAIDLR